MPMNIERKTKYPIILVHGIAVKDFKFFKAFGRIEKRLKNAGYTVYTAPVDGFGTIENNAEQLKSFIRIIMVNEQTDKVNIIAHSKGGLDAKYMIENLGMDNTVVSLTTLCTPHKGSPMASYILKYPRGLLKFIAFWINLWYKIWGDKHPDCLTVCEQLQKRDYNEVINFSDRVYCQSFSTTMERSRDDFIMGIPFMFTRYLEKDFSDGLVSVESSKFANYRGNCISESVSHTEIVGFAMNKKKRERIYAFYLQIADELAQMGI